MLLATLVVWSAAVARLWVSLKRAPSLWSWAFTVAVVAVAVGATTLAFPRWLDRTFMPGLTSLVSNLSIIVAVGLVLIHLGALLHDRPPAILLTLLIFTPAFFILQQALSWRSIPDRVWATDDLAHSSEAFLYGLGLHMYIIVGSLMVAGLVFQLVTIRDDPDVIRSIGFALVGGSALLFAVATLGLVCRTYIVNGGGRDIVVLREVQEAMNLVSLGGYGLGALLLVLGPWLAECVRSFRTYRRLRPLWMELTSRERFGPSADRPRLMDVRYRADRMVIEVLDELRGLRVRPGCDPYASVVEGILEGQRGDGVSSTMVLPLGSQDVDDREVLGRLADELQSRRVA